MVTLELIAAQLQLHPKALQRHLAAEQTTFATLVDEVRRDAAERYLRDTSMTLSHLTRELGYAEQSVLTRSCRRWLGTGRPTTDEPQPFPPERLLRYLGQDTGRSEIHLRTRGQFRGKGLRSTTPSE